MLLLLSRAPEPVDLEFIHAIDFIATYGKAFSITDQNVNGDNNFMFGERPSRFRRDEEALRELVLEGYVKPVASEKGLLYCLTARGVECSSTLDSDYARSYVAACERAIAESEQKSLEEIVREIHRLEKRTLRKGL